MGILKKIALVLLALGLLLTVLVLIRNTESGTNFLDEQFSEIVSHIPNRDRRNKKVSEVDVAWHLDHSLKTINRICEALGESKPEKYKSSFSLSRIFVLTSGVIPRGVAQSPKVVRPPKEIVTDSLYLQLEEARNNLKRLEKLDANAHFRHPYFKLINKGQTKRFLKVHTEHHLKIIRDILKK
ncbi:hypothetical protein [Flagellimonas flava]|uniref:DUF1569 domain-containing protein n=1 Tax=Flagellimonas flava TaxID=570519 RepID=A0A1M5KGR6_9FLAO|nr:hypothetical protein [Allomuricauda flava]SHG51941.1 hypothetical protein SAMN04488116_1574 [Allomuricauda flava]